MDTIGERRTASREGIFRTRGRRDLEQPAGNRRMIGNVVVKDSNGLTLVGFENHSGKTYLGKEVKPLGKVVVGNGNNGEDGFEGLGLGLQGHRPRGRSPDSDRRGAGMSQQSSPTHAQLPGNRRPSG